MITVATTVQATLEKVWDCWTNPSHIVNWNFASDDWCTSKATNELRVGGKFSSTMAAKDNSMAFDFDGTYTKVETLKCIEYVLADDRKVIITFEQNGDKVTVIESFDPEKENTLELQKMGWQAIMNNFKKYTERCN